MEPTTKSSRGFSITDLFQRWDNKDYSPQINQALESVKDFFVSKSDANTLYAQYTTTKKIAEGNSKEVYLVRPKSFNANKNIFPNSKEKTHILALSKLKIEGKNEQEVIATIKSLKNQKILQKNGNLFPVYGLFPKNGDIFLVSPFANGGDLKAYSKQFKNKFKEEFKEHQPQMIYRMVEIGSHLEKEGFSHRDLDLSNFFVTITNPEKIEASNKEEETEKPKRHYNIQVSDLERGVWIKQPKDQNFEGYKNFPLNFKITPASSLIHPDKNLEKGNSYAIGVNILKILGYYVPEERNNLAQINTFYDFKLNPTRYVQFESMETHQAILTIGLIHPNPEARWTLVEAEQFLKSLNEFDPKADQTEVPLVKFLHEKFGVEEENVMDSLLKVKDILKTSIEKFSFDKESLEKYEQFKQRDLQKIQKASIY
ncbi:MAG: hypothetical protein Tsb0021_11000 [Chlamydiales bacterium]